MIGEIESISAGPERSTTEIALEGIIPSILVDEKPVKLSITNQDAESLEETCIVELHNNDRKIISFLQQDSGSYRYTFNGLVRQLKIHPQSLARSLRRLIELRIIQKSNDGYKLRESRLLQGATGKLYDEKTAMDDRTKRNFIQLIQAHIPISSANDEIVRNLIGKRFGNLRWLGLVEGKNEYCLRWINNESSILVVVHIVSCYLTVETNALTDMDKVEAIAGGCRIFGKVIGLMNSSSVAYSVFPFDYCEPVASHQKHQNQRI